METATASETVNTAIFESEADPNENFDNLDYESESSKKAGEEFKDRFKDKIERAKKAKEAVKEDEEEEVEKKPNSKEKKGKEIDLIKNKDEELDLDGKPVKKEEKKEAKEEKEKEDKELEEEKPEAEKTEEEKKVDAKKLKIRMSDGLYGIEPDAKVRVKIDGEFQEVPVQELINQYSGKVAYDKKFTEIGQTKKEIAAKEAEVTKTTEFLKSTVSEIVKRLDDPNSSPWDAMSFLVEKAGRDPYDLWRRSIESNLEEVEKLMDMSEVERKAYFLEKKDEFRSKAEEARKAEFTKQEAFNQAVQKVDSLRQAHGVSEEQYLQALDDLETQGVDTNKMSDEQVVDYASLKPHIDDVQTVLEPYEESIDDSKYSEVVRNLARQLRAKDFTKEQLAEWARKEFMDEDLKDLTARTRPEPKKTSKVEVKAPEKLETLDFEDD